MASRAVLAAVILWLLVLSACGASSTQDSELPESTRELRDELDKRVSAEMKGEEAVAACMAREGFTYTPFTEPDFASFLPGDGAKERPSTREQVENAGFGVTHLMRALDLYELEWSAANPNDEVYNELSASEREAYLVALWGRDHQNLDLTAKTEGCSSERVQQDDVIEGIELLLRDLEAEAQIRFEADPRIIELNALWVRCMGEAGYEVVDRTTPLHLVTAKLIEAGAIQAGGFGGEGAIQPVRPQDPEAQRAVEEAFDTVFLFEQKMAMTSFDCEAGTNAEYDLIRDNYSREVVTESNDELVEILGR